MARIFLYIFLILSEVIWAFWTRCIIIFIIRLREIMYIIKASIFLFSSILANSFLLMILTYLIVNKVSTIVYNFCVSISSLNIIFILLYNKKIIFIIKLTLVLTYRKNFEKKLEIFEFIFNLKNNYNHWKYLERRFINFLGSNIGFSDLKVEF